MKGIRPPRSPPNGGGKRSLKIVVGISSDEKKGGGLRAAPLRLRPLRRGYR